MKRNEHVYPSGLIAVEWSARCRECGASVTVSHEALARRWEVAHTRYGCRRPLYLDETGRGWKAAAPQFT